MAGETGEEKEEEGCESEKMAAGRKLATRRGTNSVRKTGKGSVSVSDSEPRIFRNFYKMSSASV